MKIVKAAAASARRFWSELQPDTRRIIRRLPWLAAAIAVTALPWTWTLVLCAGLIYLLPAIEAELRDHDSIDGILLLNILLGWTVIGWIVALVWACSRPRLSNLPA